MATICLIGNPNCGKSTLFNKVTDMVAHVGNWAGVTVEEKYGDWNGNQTLDLPGIYSLSPYSPEEKLSRRFILDSEPDLIIDVIDATNLERSLYLTTQLVELGRPMILALNMQDLLEKEGIKIDLEQLSKMFHTRVVNISASKGTGIEELSRAVNKTLADKKIPSCSLFAPPLEKIITQLIADDFMHVAPKAYPRRWCAIKLLEEDELFLERMPPIPEKLQKSLADSREKLIKVFDDDIDAIIIDQRYHVAEDITKICEFKTEPPQKFKIDTILTNRFLAIPIFIMVMASVFYVSISLIGGLTIPLIDSSITSISAQLHIFLDSVGVIPFLSNMLIDGIISGVSAVLTFVPQLFILFTLLSILEDCGYMSRIAFIMDRAMRDLGLSGKSIIPLVIGTGCTVPAIMSTRTIEHPKMRKLTILVTPFIPCGAKLPIFSLIIGSFFQNAWYLAPMMYFFGILAIAITGIISQLLDRHKESNAFILELPRYQMPTLRNTWVQTMDRTKGFILKAGTTILLASIVIWFLSNYNFTLKEALPTNSMLAFLGRLIAPIFKPIGFGTWQASVALLTGIAAKESIVSTLSVALQGAAITTLFTKAGSFSFILFVLLSSPCIAALSAMATEYKDKKLFIGAIAYQVGLAYLASFISYRILLGVF
ncbi:MAG: ferrous iron transport protein B [Spirochaetaceae bacterium]|nr:ferrous iron transport protein B [Spirochaetaceae bacterium]